MKRIATAVFAAMALASALADTEFPVGKWNVVFADEGERLVLTHADGFAEVAGTVSFTGPAAVTGAGMGADGSTARWRVASSRDGFPNRLALVDTRDNVKGLVQVALGAELARAEPRSFASCAHWLAQLEHVFRHRRLEGEPWRSPFRREVVQAVWHGDMEHRVVAVELLAPRSCDVDLRLDF